MKINLRHIPFEGLDINAEDPPEIFGINDEYIRFGKPLKASVCVSRTSGGTLVVKGSLETSVSLRCGRCLKDFDMRLASASFRLVKDIKGMTEVDITEDMREEIIMLLPIKPLCRKDCMGLCPACGKDLNEGPCSCGRERKDTEWNKLDSLKLK